MRMSRTKFTVTIEIEPKELVRLLAEAERARRRATTPRNAARAADKSRRVAASRVYVLDMLARGPVTRLDLVRGAPHGRRAAEEALRALAAEGAVVYSAALCGYCLPSQ